MIPSCPNQDCKTPESIGPTVRPVVRNGVFRRASDSRKIHRFHCRACGTYFSSATLHPAYFQKKRRITHPLKLLLVSGVSQRRAAKILRVNPKTVARRFRFIASQARISHEQWLKKHAHKPIQKIQFDDLETSEHSKLKPISVSLAVEPKSRKILNFQVSRMPARGLQIIPSIKKYGHRPDERPLGWDRMFRELKPHVTRSAEWKSDENPRYEFYLRRHHPDAIYVTTPGGKGAVTGQGELKKLRYDPIFSVNHTLAMLRANLNRLFRRTWCTTKTLKGLSDHISLYVWYHNQVLTPDPQG